MTDVLKLWYSMPRRTFRTDTEEGKVASDLNKIAILMVGEIAEIRSDLARQIAITSELANENEH